MQDFFICKITGGYNGGATVTITNGRTDVIVFSSIARDTYNRNWEPSTGNFVSNGTTLYVSINTGSNVKVVVSNGNSDIIVDHNFALKGPNTSYGFDGEYSFFYGNVNNVDGVYFDNLYGHYETDYNYPLKGYYGTRFSGGTWYAEFESSVYMIPLFIERINGHAIWFISKDKNLPDHFMAQDYEIISPNGIFAQGVVYEINGTFADDVFNVTKTVIAHHEDRYPQLLDAVDTLTLPKSVTIPVNWTKAGISFATSFDIVVNP